MRPDKPRTLRLDRYRDAFPLGKTPLVMLTLFLLAALMVGLGGREKGQHLTYWAFARIHYEDYAVAKKRFEAAYPGWTVDLKLVDGRTPGQPPDGGFHARQWCPGCLRYRHHQHQPLLQGQCCRTPH